MATNIETLKKPNGDQVLPRTRAKAVSMESGDTVEAAINELKSQVTAAGIVVETQMGDTPTGTFLVTDSLKIKSSAGIGISAEGDMVTIGIDAATFPKAVGNIGSFMTLQSPNGTKYTLAVTDDGVLVANLAP